MDKNSELLLHIFLLQRDHTLGFRQNQLVGILYSVFSELKYQGFTHDYKFSFKRWGENPTSQEMLDILKDLTASGHLEKIRNQKQESVYVLGVKGAMVSQKIKSLDPQVKNSVMAWIGYFLPMNPMTVDRHLYNIFKLSNFEIGDPLPLAKSPFIKKSSFSQAPDDDDWF